MVLKCLIDGSDLSANLSCNISIMINDNYVHITQLDTKSIPNCDVSFANGEHHQARGHVTLLMNARPKYGRRS